MNSSLIAGGGLLGPGYRIRVLAGVVEPLGLNADAKAHRGLDRLAVRGLGKVLGSASLFALTCNLLRLITLRG